jgi:hypothetical protein
LSGLGFIEMKQLILEISNCSDCPYSIGFKHKYLCKLSDKKLDYFENIVSEEIPNWCELEDKDRTGEAYDLP